MVYPCATSAKQMYYSTKHHCYSIFIIKKITLSQKNDENQDILIGLTNISPWFSIRPVQNEIVITIQSIKASKSSKNN